LLLGQLAFLLPTPRKCWKPRGIFPDSFLEGFTNKEIAAKMDRSLATVERKLDRIRSAWEKETAP
jgi:DNA-directed RNA polymerase specialized sigma24 family protein